MSLASSRHSAFRISRVTVSMTVKASLDRYSTIRNFFRLHSTKSLALPSCETHGLASRSLIHGNVSIGLLLRRDFHVTALVLKKKGRNRNMNWGEVIPIKDTNLSSDQTSKHQKGHWEDLFAAANNENRSDTSPAKAEGEQSDIPSYELTKEIPQNGQTLGVSSESSEPATLCPPEVESWESKSEAHKHPKESSTTAFNDIISDIISTEATQSIPPSSDASHIPLGEGKTHLQDSAPENVEPEIHPPPPPPTAPGPKHPIPNLDNYSRFFRNLAMSMPHLPRPTRDDFLKVADGFWQRLRIRFKWFTVRSFRKFNADDISAFLTWFLMSQTLWILVGTTTFFSVIFAIMNSLRMQNFVARKISDYLTSETGVTIIFESAIVPIWKNSKISFKNVYVSRRPLTQEQHQQRRRSGHLSAVAYDVSNHPENLNMHEEDEEYVATEEDDLNYSMYDLNLDSVDVTLSLWRWLDGKGLIVDAVVKGVRGVLDRRHVFYDSENPFNPADFRHPHYEGDWELESLELEDLLITVYQPGDFRPYTASIFKADIRTFRKQWMFYDFLCAENIVGQIDNCLFSLHKPQSIGRTTERDLEDGEWSRMSRFRIDGVPIDHFQQSSSLDGPIAWIKSGKVDAVLDIKFPRDPQDRPLNEILGDIADAITTSLSAAVDPALQRIPGQRELAKPPLSAPTDDTDSVIDEISPKVIVDIDMRFRDVKAAVPLFTNDLSYVNNALIRPIVAFMNANRTLIPIHCRVVKDLSEFDGSWTMWETGLSDEISLQIYDALAFHVMQANMNRRFKTVSLWSLQRTAAAAISALRALFDPISSQYRESRLNGDGYYDNAVSSMGIPLGYIYD